MSEDLTKQDSDVENERVKLILTLVEKLQDYGPILIEIRDGIAKLTSRVDALETRLTAVERRLDVVETRLNVIETRLNVIETRLNVIEGRLDALEARFESFEKTIKRSVHYLDRGQSVLNDSILKIHVGLIDMDERQRGIEPQHKQANSST